MKTINKQFIAFLSLLSLVLVLGVYYVIIPKNQEQGKEVTKPVIENKDSLILYFNSINDERDFEMNKVLTDINDKIAENISNSEKISLLTNEKNEVETLMNYESKFEESIIGLGTPAAFVKIDATLIYIIVYKLDTMDEVKVAKSINEEIYKSLGSNKVIPIKIIFKNK